MARSQLKELFQTGLESQTDAEAAIVGGIDSMEAACLDVEEAYQEVATVEQDLSDLEDIEAGLESVVESLEAALEQGGLDATAAQFAHHAVGAYTERLGLEATDLLPGLESFGGDSGRQSATTVSLESVGETLKKIWNAIKAAVEKAIKAVTDFFAKIFGGVAKLEQRIDALEKEVNDLGNKTRKDKAKVKVGSANSIQYGGKVDANALSSGMSNLVATNEETFGNLLDAAADAYKEKADQITKLKDKDEDAAAEAAQKAILDSQEKVVKSAQKFQGKILPGDKVLTATVKEDGDDKSFKMGIDSAKGAKAFSGSNEIDALTEAQMKGLLADAKKAVKAIKDSKDGIEKVKKARKDAMDAAKKVVDDSDRGRVGKVWTKGRAQWALRSTQRDLLRPVTQLASHNFSVLRSVLAVVESSTKQYDEKKGD